MKKIKNCCLASRMLSQSNKSHVSSRKLGLENLEERQLLSASTLAEAVAIADLTSNAAVFAQQEEAFAPIDLSNAVGDTIVVTSTASAGSGSLRAAILSATGGETIVFDSSLAGATIMLDTELNVQKDVTIDGGVGGDRVTVNANGNGAAFLISGSDVVLKDLVITGAVDKNGAVKYDAANGTLTVTNCVFTENSNNSHNKGGGGALNINSAANVTVTDSVFDSNTASTYGAAIYAESSTTLTVDGCEFIDNTASKDGGAIYTKSSSTTLSVTDSIFYDNHAMNGGSIYAAQATTLTIAGSEFENNSASVDGGAVYVSNYSSRVSVTDSIFYDNHANDGGAVYMASLSTVLFDNIQFTENSVSNNGGAIYFQDGTNHVVKNSNFRQNSAHTNGGSWYAGSGSGNGTFVQFQNISEIVNTAPNGGAGYLSSSAYATFVNALAVENSTGFFISANATADFTNATIANNGGWVQYDITGDTSGSIRGRVTLQNSILNPGNPNNGLNTGAVTVDSACNSVLNKVYPTTYDYANNVVYTWGAVIFTDSANHDYTLVEGSLAVDIGDNSYVAGIDFDLRGAPYHRVANSIVDAGAYELQVLEEPSIIVTTTEDVVNPSDGKISLREAVEVYFAYESRLFDSTVDSTGQTVTFQLATPGDVTLGGSEVTISESMAIYGGTSATITISGDNSSRIFKVADDVASVDFQGLKFTEGKAYAIIDAYESGDAYDDALEAYDGGAIYATTAAITVASSDFMLNSGYIGGAVFVGGGTLEITDTTFAHNESAYQGGAVALYGANSTNAALVVADSIFETNESDRAGALYFKDGVATIDDSFFCYNEAKYASGGAITVANATLTATNVDMTVNTAGRFGGAIFAGTSDVTINNTADGIAISYNLAQYGGAIYNSKGTVDVKAGVISDNMATFSGGAIYSSGALAVSGTFTDNDSDEHGGAIYTLEDITVTDATFSNNRAVGAGGAIYATKCDATVSGATFNSNSSLSSGGGAIRLAKVGSATFENATFENNDAAVAGGAINASATTSLTISGGSFAGNSASNSGGAIYAASTSVNSANVVYDGNETQKFGGAIAVVNESELLVERGTFKNSASSAGGAIYAADSEATITADILNNTATTYGGGIYGVSADIIVQKSQLIGNTATSSGGAIFASKCSTEVELTDIADNAATSGFGGAIYASSNGETLTLKGVEVSGNTATNSGGAVYSYHTEVVVRSAVEDGVETATAFDGNESQKFGGAIYVVSAGADVVDAEFVHNVAETGGAIYAGGDVTLTDATFTTNSASNWGGAIYMKDGVAEFEGVEFSENTATSNGGALYLHTATATLTSATFSENTATVYGGAIEQVDGSLTISSATFSKNASQKAGGAIYQLHGTSTISNASFTENEATTKAGALYVGAGASTISGTTFSGNVAPRGTAVSALNATSLEIDGESYPATGAIEEEDLSSSLLDEAFAELFFEELD